MCPVSYSVLFELELLNYRNKKKHKGSSIRKIILEFIPLKWFRCMFLDGFTTHKNLVSNWVDTTLMMYPAGPLTWLRTKWVCALHFENLMMFETLVAWGLNVQDVFMEVLPMVVHENYHLQLWTLVTGLRMMLGLLYCLDWWNKRMVRCTCSYLDSVNIWSGSHAHISW